MPPPFWEFFIVNFYELADNGGISTEQAAVVQKILVESIKDEKEFDAVMTDLVGPNSAEALATLHQRIEESVLKIT